MPPAASIRMEQVMSHFQVDIFQGDVSFPFELPVSPNNVKALGAPHLLDLYDRSMEFQVQMYWHNVKRTDAKLVIQKASRFGYTINIVYGIAGMEVLNKKLPELDLGGIRILGTDNDSVIASANATVNNSYPSAEYNFPPIANSKFYDGANPLYSGIINRYDLAAQTILAAHSSTDMISVDKDTLVPLPYLVYVMKQGFLEAGYELRGDFIRDADWSQALLYNNRSLDKALEWENIRASVTAQHTGSQILFADDYTAPNTDINNLWIITNPFTSIAASSLLINFLGDYVIYFNLDLLSMTDTIHTIMTLRLMVDGVEVDNFGWDVTAIGTVENYSGTFLWTATSANLLSVITLEVDSLDNGGLPLSVDIYSGYVTIGFSNPTLVINQLNTELNLQNHVPNITFGELLKRLRNRACLSMNVDVLNQVIDISFTETAITAPPDIDLTNKVSREYTIESEANEGYTFSDSFPSTDNLVTDNFKIVNSELILGEYLNVSSLPSASTAVGKFAFIKNQNCYFQTMYDPTTGTYYWNYYTDRHYPVIIGNGSEGISSELTPLFMREQPLPGGTALIPTVNQVGQSLTYNGLNEFTDTRIIFWKGKKYNQSAQLYPFATSTRFDASGNICGTVVFRWEGDDGFYKIYYEKWITILMRGEIVRRMVNFTLIDLLNLTEKKKRIGFQSYLFRKVSTLWGKTIEASEVEMIKL